MYVVPDRMKYIDYTDPYDIAPASFMLSKYAEYLVLFVSNTINITFELAKPPNPPQWKAILDPLETTTWMALMLAFVSATFFLTLISKPSWNNNPHIGVFDCKIQKLNVLYFSISQYLLQCLSSVL